MVEEKGIYCKKLGRLTLVVGGLGDGKRYTTSTKYMRYLMKGRIKFLYLLPFKSKKKV